MEREEKRKRNLKILKKIIKKGYGFEIAEIQNGLFKRSGRTSEK